MDWLPAASRHPYSVNGGSWTDRSDPKGCLHTTEGASWPTYSDGAVAPHATVLPIPGKGVEVRQHTPFTVAARALRNPSGGVETNRDYVFQFELIGTCEKGGPGYYWPGADDAVLADLFRKVIKPLSDAFAIPLRAPTFMAYPASYGESNPNRMSGSRFDSYSGWLGHQHVPENDHGDPGAFPWARMLAVAAGEVDDDMQLSDKVKVLNADGTTEEIPLSWLFNRLNWSATTGDKVQAAQLKSLQTTVAAQSAAINALARGMDVAAIQKAIKDAADAVFDGYEVTLKATDTPGAP